MPGANHGKVKRKRLWRKNISVRQKGRWSHSCKREFLGRRRLRGQELRSVDLQPIDCSDRFVYKEMPPCGIAGMGTQQSYAHQSSNGWKPPAVQLHRCPVGWCK